MNAASKCNTLFSDSRMKLTDILDLSCVKVPLLARDKHEAIVSLVTLLAENGRIKDSGVVMTAVLERESIRSTGIGHGVAVPHGKCASVDRPVMALGRLIEPIEYGSLDQQAVSLIALLISPIDQTGPHIMALPTSASWRKTTI
jgi:mannitol/fructose-specific phosphotransferase system IIA component (Ntr-type)